MNLENLSRIDLNLLVCLKVLFEELNVTRAANRLYVSQSAVSKSLAKLRIQFEDPLFVRTSHGLKPTPRALNLHPKLDRLIHQLELINQPDIFAPDSSRIKFNIALVESAYPLILPHFLPALFSNAPHISISSHNWTDETFQNIRNGELDIGITGRDIDMTHAALTMPTPKYISETEIYRDRQMCVIRKNHPILDEEWTLDRYLALRHIQVRCDGSDRWLLDYKLAEQGCERDIAITVPDFNSASALCTYSDFIFTAPSYFTKLVANHYDLTLVPLPLDFPPMAYTLFWSTERENDPALSWLKTLIIEKTQHLR
ncbi:LysR substrate-binding domain-containing protein [Vibrio sp. F74]|uniref:LysR substrate-binding domain-containing protein n=1 Tax=Vibrio sp. F74 TaxID=700020 RepID=UPI0035F53EF5